MIRWNQFIYFFGSSFVSLELEEASSPNVRVGKEEGIFEPSCDCQIYCQITAPNYTRYLSLIRKSHANYACFSTENDLQINDFVSIWYKSCLKRLHIRTLGILLNYRELNETERFRICSLAKEIKISPIVFAWKAEKSQLPFAEFQIKETGP